MIKVTNPNYSYKSFINYNMDESLSFNKKNIIFAYNGRGKTSFSKSIVDTIKASDDYYDNSYKLYNKDYLTLEVINKDNGRLKGIKATFGEKAQKDNDSIKNLEAKLVDEGELVKNRDDYKQSIDDIIETTVKATKDKNSRVSLSYCDNFFELLDENIKKAEKYKSKDELRNLSGKIDYESIKSNILGLNVIELFQIEKGSFDNVQEILHKEYVDGQVPSQLVIEWIRDGLDVHSKVSHTKCLFCGNDKLDIEDIQKKYDIFVKSKKQQDRSVIVNNYKLIKSHITVLENFLIERKLWESAINKHDALNTSFNSLSSYLESLKESSLILEEKINNFDHRVELNTNLQQIYDGINSCISEIRLIKENALKNTIEEEKKYNEILKGAISVKLFENEKLKKDIKYYIDCFNKVNDVIKNNRVISNKIKEIKDTFNSIGNFSIAINNVLRDLGIKFKLDIIENEYRIVSTIEGNSIDINEISEGERNLLSFAFFYFEMLEDDKTDTFKKEIKYIILDDPITSLDQSNTVYLLTLIRNILDAKDIQVFVLTHSWEDFVQMTYGRHEDTNYYEIIKDSFGHSSLVKTKTNITPYDHDFIQLLRSNEQYHSPDQITDEDVYNLPNCMRRVLEGFLAFKTPNCKPTNNNISEIARVLLGELPENLSSNNKRKLQTTLSVINVSSHSPVRRKDEVFIALRFLLSKISDADACHYNCMKNKKSTLDSCGGNE